MSYDPALSRTIDRLRFAVVDTDGPAPTVVSPTAEQLAAEMLPDATYLGLLAYHANNEAATTLALAEHLMLKFSSLPDSVVNGGKYSAIWGSRFAAWRDIIARLRPRVDAAASGASGYRTFRMERGGQTAAEYSRGRRISSEERSS